MKGVTKYWGYLLLIVAMGLWFSRSAGPAVLIALSAFTTAYFLFQAPVWCGAENRDGTLCRRNASGVLMGCGYRQHKWQKLKMAFVPRMWGKLNRGLWTSPTTSLATASTLIALATSFVGLHDKQAAEDYDHKRRR